MHLHLSHGKEHWTQPDEKPPVSLILCSSAGESMVRYTLDTLPNKVMARYTLDTLPNKVMAREYQLALPAAKKLEAELAATRKRLERAGKR